MNRLLPVVVIVALVAVAAYFVWTNLLHAPAAPLASPETPTAAASDEEILPPVQADSGVVADAVVMPVRRADLSLPTSGIVAEILVQEGDTVDSGQVLLRLDAALQQAGLNQAEAGLARVQAQLAEAQAAARPEEVESAQAAVDAAQAQLDRLQEGARPEDVAAAQAALDGARAGLQKVLEGADDQQVIAAQADLANAEAALRQAQAAYDQVSSRDDIGQLPQSLELEQATNAYEAAKARLNDLQQGATAADVAAAQAQVRQAQAQLEGVQAPARAADLAAAQAELRSAQAQLALVQAGPRPESLTVIEAEVASARAAVEQARASLAQTELVAPFAGTVAQVLPAAGEQVSPGSPLVRLADLSAWQVETDDLTELQVVDVRPGDPVSIKFDALPGLELAGTVSRVQDIGVNKQGDITYTVIIVPASSDPRLRWNMTAEVKIEPAS